MPGTCISLLLRPKVGSSSGRRKGELSKPRALDPDRLERLADRTGRAKTGSGVIRRSRSLDGERPRTASVCDAERQARRSDDWIPEDRADGQIDGLCHTEPSRIQVLHPAGDDARLLLRTPCEREDSSGLLIRVKGTRVEISASVNGPPKARRLP